jgi:hypothetical protein
MEYFSDTSGGVSLSGIEIPDVLTQIGNDEKSTYTITYEPGPDNWDKKFHKVKTTCERKGLKIQARNRYFAVPVSVAEQRAQTAPPAKDEDDAIIAALENPGDVSNIGLHVAVSPAAGKPNTLHFQIRVDAADLQLQEKAGAFDGQVAIALADYTATGLKGLPVPNEINLHLTAERHATAMKDGISIAMDHAIDGTIHFVRFILFDHARNTFGSLAIPVSLPAAPAAK